jgi:hypothetical protein
MTEPSESATPDAAGQPEPPDQPDQPGQPEAEQPGPEQPDAGQPGRPERVAGRPVRLVFAAIAVLLLAFGATMTVLYVRAADARNQAAATAANRAAQLDHLRRQLAEVRALQAVLQTQLTAAQDKALDPAGYQKIKNCVQTYAQIEADLARILADPNGPHPLDGSIVTAPTFVGPGVKPGGKPGTFTPSTICKDAAKYLK